MKKKNQAAMRVFKAWRLLADILETDVFEKYDEDWIAIKRTIDDLAEIGAKMITEEEE